MLNLLALVETFQQPTVQSFKSNKKSKNNPEKLFNLLLEIPIVIYLKYRKFKHPKSIWNC